MRLKISHVHDAHAPRYRLLFDREVIVVGGAGSCNVVLTDSTVASRHIRITVRGDQILVEDFGAGTMINDRLIDEPTLASFDDAIVIGETLLELERATVVPKRVTEQRPAVPSATEQGFLDTLRADPKDDTTRSIYADWLEAEGFPSCAAFIRLELDGNPKIETSELVHRVVAMTTPEWRALVSRTRIWQCLSDWCPLYWHLLVSLGEDCVRICGRCADRVSYCVDVDAVAECAQRLVPIALDAGLRQNEAVVAYGGWGDGIT